MDINVNVTINNEFTAAIFALADALEGYPKHGSAPLRSDTIPHIPQPDQPAIESEKPVKKAEKAEKAPTKAEEKQEKQIEFETVRAKMAQVMAAIGVDNAKKLVADMGFDGLSKVTPDKYPELLAKADEALAK